MVVSSVQHLPGQTGACQAGARALPPAEPLLVTFLSEPQWKFMEWFCTTARVTNCHKCCRSSDLPTDGSICSSFAVLAVSAFTVFVPSQKILLFGNAINSTRKAS